MKGNFHKPLAVLMTLILLAGCAGTDGPSSLGYMSPASSSPEASLSEETVSSTTDELEKLDALAILYEKYCWGRTLSVGDTVEARGGVAFGLLYQNGLLDPYWSETYEHWGIPAPVLEGINRYFFQDLTELSDWDREQYSLYSGDGDVTLAFSLVREEVQELADGSIEATYRRVSGDHTLTPVTYRFRPYTLETFPEALEGICQPGETLYLYVSVTQREDLLPEDDPQTFEIATVEELLSAAQRINEGRYESRHDTYLLTADIDLAGVEWTPMGLGNPILEFAGKNERDPNVQGFNGTFDGQGHTIYNLTITEEQGAALLAREEQNFPDRTLGGAGFFYRIGPEGVVKDLRMENASVSVPVDDEEDSGSAAILAMSCSGRLENISVQGKVQGVSDTGGLVGTLGGVDMIYLLDGSFESSAVAENCTADVEVSGYAGIGGLAGCLHYGTLTNCAAQGIVTAVEAGYGITANDPPRNIGGLVGHGIQGRAIDSGASVYLSTQVPSRCVGGLGGLWESGCVISCWVDGQKLGSWEPVDDYHRLEPEEPEVEVR